MLTESGDVEIDEEEVRMEWVERAALIVETMDRMRDNGGWTDERHVHMCLFFLQEMRGVPFGFEFVINGYGVFSRDAKQDILELRAGGLVELVSGQSQRRAGLEPLKAGRLIRERHSHILERHEDDLAFVAKHFGSKSTRQLQNASASFYFLINGAENDFQIAHWIDLNRPFVSWKESLHAVEEVMELAGQSDWARKPEAEFSPAAVGTISSW